MKKIILIIIFLITYSAANAYDQNTVHIKINDSALNNSRAKEIIRTQLFTKGIEERVKDKEIRDWIIEGGRDEDNPEARGLWHFHDPLKPWESAGLLGTFKSSILFAQDAQNNGFTWQRARSLYYEGLTAIDIQTRDAKLAMAFKTVGQVMHLISDMAVPAHTRNDQHMLSEPYEKYTKGKESDLDFTPATVPSGIFDYFIANTSAPVQITALWDTNRYDGSTPWAGGFIGLAEITNANFLSEDTMFKDYPHPKANYTEVFPSSVTARDGTYDNVRYLRGVVNTYLPEKLAAVRYLTQYVDELGTSIDVAKYYLDDEVHKAYAKKLVPLAVGYSAALLDYFFRGQIEISLPDSGVYLKTDDANPEAGFIPQVKLRVENKSPNGQTMTDGSIELVVKYRKAQSDPFRNGGVPVDDEYAYIVVPVANGIRTIPFTTPVELTFNLPQGANIPLYAVDVHLQVVYKGKLGSEDNAVAVGYKHVSPSTPVDLFNNMDKICISGTWFDAGSQAAVTRVDTDNNGVANEYDVYAHGAANTYVRISPKDRPVNVSLSDYTIKVNSIAGGQLKRSGFIITDKEFNWSMESDVVATNQDDPWDELMKLMPAESRLAPEFRFSQYSRPEDCATYGSTAQSCTVCYEDFERFRTKEMWGGAGVIFINQEVPPGMICNYNLLD